MESEQLKKLEGEAITLLNKLDVMTDKGSDSYRAMQERYAKTQQMVNEETERLNSIQKMELEERRLMLEQDKIDNEGQRARLNADIEEEKLRQQKRAHWWDIAKKIVSAIAAAAANAGIIYLTVRMNNSGETLTSFENKFISPERLSK